jgi:curved DNA-binding protein
VAERENLYDILGVKKNASDDALRAAYRKLARKYHPDVNPGDAEAEARFKKVAAAYDVLSDKAKRSAYDEFGDASLQGGFDPEKARSYQSWRRAREGSARSFDGQRAAGEPIELDLEDLFGFGRQRRRRPARGPDIHAVVDMELRQAITGGEVSLAVPGQDKPLVVRIPAGADDGSVIRLAGKGAPSPTGGPPGDLVIETRVRRHPLVQRDGLDLSMRVPVTLDEAYNGASIDIPTFDGPVKLRIPPRSQPGSRLRLRGKGVPRKDKRGDFYVELDVKLPDKHHDRLAEAARDSADAYSAPVRKEIRL